MKLQALAEGLAPAILAGLFGTIAQAVWASPEMTIAAGVLGAGAGAMIGGADERTAPIATTPQPAAPPPSAISAREVLAALPFAAFIADRSRIITVSNDKVQTLFGVQIGEGVAVATLRAHRLLDLIDRVLSAGEADTLEFPLSRSQGLHLRAHVHPLDNDTVLVLLVDETQSKKSKASHRDFVANASHELKTPLAAVAGIIETLIGPAREDRAATERFLRLLSDQAQRMTRLIEDLMSLNRVELNERVEPDEPENVTALIGEVVDGLIPIAEVSGVTLELDVPPEQIWIKADRNEVSQLFRNLVDNAIKYGGKGNTVRIGRCEDSPHGRETVGFFVADEGPGISREEIPRVTERFYRVNVKRSREAGGTGLGLAICQHIVNRHRGRLEIESGEGQGARFIVWLPVLERVAAQDRDGDRDPIERGDSADENSKANSTH